jgi:hypothetical protein
MWLVLTINLLVPIAAAVTSPQGEEKTVRHVETAGGYSVVVPRDWKVHEFPGFKYKVIAGAPEKGFAPNIVFVDESFAGNLKEYVAASKKQLHNVFKELKELSETELKTADGASFIRLVIENKQDGKALRQSFYFFELAAGKKLIATCTVLADGGEKHDAAFEACLKTFRVEKNSK